MYSSNKEPLGSRKRPQEEEPPIFDQAVWRDWRPTSKEQATADYRSSMRRGVEDVKDMVENFKGKRGDAEYAEVLFYGNTYRQLLGMLSEDMEVGGLVGRLDAGMGELEEKLEMEERQLKAISKLMAELEEEMEWCYSDRTSQKYDNIKERMKLLTQILAAFKPGKPALEMVKSEYNSRLGELWKDFESRSDSLVENLQQQMAAGTSSMGEPGPSGRFEEHSRIGGSAGDPVMGREAAVEEYRLHLTQFVTTQLEVPSLNAEQISFFRKFRFLDMKRVHSNWLILCFLQRKYGEKFENTEAPR